MLDSMTRLKRLGIAGMLAGSLAACNAETESENETVSRENAQAADEMAEMDDPSNPFAAVEMQMHERMMAARGTDVSEGWARKMIEHHRGAVAMSEVLLARDPNSRFADMARTTIRDQTAEIGELESMLAPDGGAPEPAAARPAVPRTTPTPETPPKAESEPANAEPAPPQADDTHAGHDMDDMSNSM